LKRKDPDSVTNKNLFENVLSLFFQGNVVMWKPSDTAVLSNYLVYQIYREAGLPPGVINFITADGPVFGNTVTASPDLCGINFTGSVKTFQHLWKQIGANLEKYKTYPRLIGGEYKVEKSRYMYAVSLAWMSVCLFVCLSDEAIPLQIIIIISNIDRAPPSTDCC
jgi:hypothetical protein